MLSRTADHLFWLARYLERAENMARMLDMNHQMSMMPQSLQMAHRNWRASLETFQLTSTFDEHYELLSQQDVLNFMCFDERNSASIYHALKSAHDNAKAVRGQLGSELWQTINTTWIEYQDWQRQVLDNNDYVAFYEWLKMRSQLQQGIFAHNIYHDETKRFFSLGLYLERADNIARLIDVKFYTLGTWLDDQKDAAQQDHAHFYHWASMLKAVCGFEAFRKKECGAIDAQKVIDLLVFNVDFPRSMACSMQQVYQHLQALGHQNAKDLEREAGKLSAALIYGSCDINLLKDLHGYLMNFLADLQEMNQMIMKTFMLNIEAIA